MLSNIAHTDPLGRITGIVSGSLQNLSYSWDHLGNLTYRSDNLSSGNVSESFQYDLLNRLLSAQVTNGSGAQPALSYQYDAIGDISSKSDTGSYTYSGAGPRAVQHQWNRFRLEFHARSWIEIQQLHARRLR